MPTSKEAFALFTVVGFGSGWITNDAVFANMGWLMDALPAEGLYLPTHADVAAKTAIVVVSAFLWVAFLGAGYVPGFAEYKRLVWLLYAGGVSANVMVALLWWVTVGSVSPVILLAMCIGSACGTISIAYVWPLAPVFFESGVVAALIAGNGIAALVTGLLGLLQAEVPAFGVLPFTLCVAAMIATAAAAWSYILHHRLGFRTAAPKEAAAASRDKAAGEGSVLLTTAPALLTSVAGPTDATPSCVVLLRECATMLALALPTGGATWGVALPILQFATAHASCDCSPHAATTRSTYTLATSGAFVLMPFGALLAQRCPTTDLRVLALLDVLQLLMLGVQLGGVAAADPMTCKQGARLALIATTAAMRMNDTYIMTRNPSTGSKMAAGPAAPPLRRCGSAASAALTVSAARASHGAWRGQTSSSCTRDAWPRGGSASARKRPAPSSLGNASSSRSNCSARSSSCSCRAATCAVC